DGNSEGRTHPIAEKSANSWGLYDMGGLLWEWCGDAFHDNDQGAPVDGSPWLGGDPVQRVLRGGSWNDYPWECRCASRFWCHPDRRSATTGLRVVRVVP